MVLLDCSMPRADAFDCLPELRRISPSSRVVLMSGHAAGDVEMAAHSAGALGFLGKDILPSQFPAELATVAGMVGAVEAVLFQASTSLSNDPRSAGDARRFVAGTLEPWQLGPLVDTVTLLTSELGWRWSRRWLGAGVPAASPAAARRSGSRCHARRRRAASCPSRSGPVDRVRPSGPDLQPLTGAS